MPASARNGGRSSHLKFTPSCVSLRDALQFLSFSSPKQKRCQNFSRKNKVMGDVGSKTICEADSVDLVYLVHRVHLVDLVPVKYASLLLS